MSVDVLALANEAAQTTDQSVDTGGGGFDYTPPEAGVTILRFVEYIEIGKQPQKPFEGKPKPDCEEVFLGFELLHPKHIQKYTDAEGKEQEVPHFLRIRMPIKTGDKARFKKLFKKMAYGRDIKHMAQMLGEGFIADVFHYVKDEKTTYANLDKDGEWSLRSPIITDVLSGESKTIAIPQPTRDLRIFLWDRANIETWNTLHIEGTRKTKVDGVETEVSKNWMQELILKAKNFNGSKLQTILAGVSGLSVDPLQEAGNQPAPDAQSGAEGTASPSEQALGALEESKPVEQSATDDLASLGLS